MVYVCDSCVYVCDSCVYVCDFCVYVSTCVCKLMFPVSHGRYLVIVKQDHFKILYCRVCTEQVHQVATQAELEEILSNSGDALVCIDFTATWCSPCQQIAPAFQQLSEELTDVVFLKVDVDENEVSASTPCVFAAEGYVSKKSDLITVLTTQSSPCCWGRERAGCATCGDVRFARMTIAVLSVCSYVFVEGR